MEKFLKSQQYKDMKFKYEREYFKLGGDYAWYDGDKITHKSTNKIAEHFKNKKVTIEIEKETPDGDTIVTKKSKSFYQIWSEDPNMKEYNEVVFDCNVKRVKPTQFNLFDGFAIADHRYCLEGDNFKKAQEGLKIINDQISILANHNPEHVKLILYFLAQAIQQPHLLPMICLVFISDEGVGKDLFYKLIKNLFGAKYCFNVDSLDLIVGNFNSTAGGKIMGVINETDPVDSKKRRDNIKYAVTAEERPITGKYKDPVIAPNFCRLIFFMNRLTGFPVEKGARRPWVFNPSSENLPENIGAEESVKYFNNLAAAINDKNVLLEFYLQLKEFDLKSVNIKAMEKSEMQQKLEDNAKSPMVEFLSQIVYDHRNKEKYCVHTTKLLQQYTEFMKARNMKYDVVQKTFNDELEIEYKVIKYDSCGRPKFELQIADIKAYLEKKYKCKFNFDDTDEANDEDYEYGVEKLDMSVKMSLDEQILHVSNILEKLKQKKAEQDKKPEDKPVIITKDSYFGKVKVPTPNSDEEDEKLVKKRKCKQLVPTSSESEDLKVTEIKNPCAAFM